MRRSYSDLGFGLCYIYPVLCVRFDITPVCSWSGVFIWPAYIGCMGDMLFSVARSRLGIVRIGVCCWTRGLQLSQTTIPTRQISLMQATYAPDQNYNAQTLGYTANIRFRLHALAFLKCFFHPKNPFSKIVFTRGFITPRYNSFFENLVILCNSRSISHSVYSQPTQ